MVDIFDNVHRRHVIGRRYSSTYLQRARRRTHHSLSTQIRDDCNYSWQYIRVFLTGHAKRGKNMKVQRATLFAVLSVGAMVAAIVIGLIVIGSPREFRMRRLDQRRAEDLAVISSAIRTYRLTHENLPQKLE